MIPWWTDGFHEEKHSYEELGIDIEIDVFDSGVRFGSGDGPWHSNIVGSVALRTVVSDLGNVFDFILEYADIIHEIKSLAGRHFSGRSSVKSDEPAAQDIRMRYDVDGSSLNDHCFFISTDYAVDGNAVGLMIRNEINIPDLEVYVSPKHSLGGIPASGVGRFEDSKGEKFHRRLEPVKLRVYEASMRVVWESQQLRIDLPEDVKMCVSIDHIHDLLVLLTRGFQIHALDSFSDSLSRNVACALDRYFKAWKGGCKTLVDKALNLNLNVERTSTSGARKSSEFALLTVLSCPVEMIESSQVLFDIPETMRIEMRTKTRSPKLPDRDLFFSMDVSLGAGTVENSDYRLVRMECVASEFPPEKITAERITCFGREAEDGKRQSRNGDVDERAVYIDIHIKIGDKQHLPITMSREAFKWMMLYVRNELMGGNAEPGMGGRNRSRFELCSEVVAYPMGKDPSWLEELNSVSRIKDLLEEMEEKYIGGLLAPPNTTSRIHTEIIGEMYRDAESNFEEGRRILDSEPIGFTSWDSENKVEKKLEFKYYSEALRDFLFSRVPNVLLRSFYRVIPTRLGLSFSIGHEVVTMHLESNYKNEWTKRSPATLWTLGRYSATEEG